LWCKKPCFQQKTRTKSRISKTTVLLSHSLTFTLLSSLTHFYIVLQILLETTLSFPAMDELFSATFSALRKRVMEGPRQGHPEPQFAPAPPIPFAQSSSTTSGSSNPTISEERSTIQDKIKEMREKKDIKVKNISKYLNESEEILHLMHNNEVSTKNSCQQHCNYTLKQLNTQHLLAERRMRELVFEVMGEYGKCSLRSRRRHAYLRCSYRIKKAVLVFQMRWNYFMGRLVFETIQQQHIDNIFKFQQDLQLNMDQYSNVCPQRSKEEYALVKKVACAVLPSTSPRDVMVSMVMKFVTPGARDRDRDRAATNTPRGQRRAARVSSPVLATSVHDLRKLVREAKRYINMGQSQSQSQSQSSGNRPSSSSSKRTQQPHNTGTNTSSSSSSSRNNSSTLLSTASIEWLRPCSYHPISADTLASLFSYSPAPATCLDPGAAPGRPQGALASAMATPNRFDSFSHRFLSQHCARPGASYVYFCLEERASSVLDTLPSSGQASRVNDAASLHLLRYLQVTY
jgi:hypothetical protein